MYGIREIARDRNNVVKWIVQRLRFATAYAVDCLGVYCCCNLMFDCATSKSWHSLIWVLSLTIFFTTIGCEWFYQGIEDFKYITVRGLIVKSISMLLLFAFVKTKDDLIYYGWYTVIGILGGNIFNFFRLRKYINKDNIVFQI